MNYREKTHAGRSANLPSHNGKPRLERGLIHYYFGDGKGKTTALIGLIIRALGNDLRPVLIQFLKQHERNQEEEGFFIGEINFLEPFIEIKQFGNGQFISSNDSNKSENVKMANDGLKYAEKVILSGEYDLVGLDEIINAISLKLINIDKLIEVLQKKPEHVEVVCTGLMFYSSLREISDYVITFNSVKHPYNRGIKSRKGIEY
jgi:cob(I)alamin adenosyltransferase